jgi:acyl-CoA oxidase
MADPFNSAAFLRTIDHDNFKTREAIRAVSGDPLFTPRYNVSLRYERELALEQMRKITELGVVSVRDFGRNPSNIFTAHECIG